MKQFFSKPYRWALIYSSLLSAATAFVILDAFVIPKSLSAVSATETTTSTSNEETEAGVSESVSEQTITEAIVTESSYEDENIQIAIETGRSNNTTYYAVDIQVSDASFLKTALAQDTYGRNIKAVTSSIAASHDAILAINGDFYGFRDAGYVLRNATLYRDSARETEDAEALVIDDEGDFSIISENETSLSSLDTSSIAQIISFGPALIEDGEISVDASSEVSQSMTSNPRTAIGQISPLHYIIIVSDGRTDESEGFSLLQLAEEMQNRGAVTAYNLDGGGSSTLYFNGEIINNPTSGNSTGEREVSDIVYIGYE
jgi:exopolysaccharide biosynthesis protein